MSEQRKAVIKNADMDEKMQQDAVDTASKALAEYNIEKVSYRQNPTLQYPILFTDNHLLSCCDSSRMSLLI